MRLKYKYVNTESTDVEPLFHNHYGDAGLDITCTCDTRILGGIVTFVNTGLQLAIPDGHFGMLALRSGWSSKHNCIMPNGVGIIDSNYRGEIKVPIYYLRPNSFTLYKGTRFAQIVIIPYRHITPVLSDIDDFTTRGDGGFGSTGE